RLSADDPLTALTAVCQRCIGVLLQSGDVGSWRARIERATGAQAIVRTLSETGDLAEAARNLFAAMRALDESPAEILIAEPCDEARGLGWAIDDRLRRAASLR